MLKVSTAVIEDIVFCQPNLEDRDEMMDIILGFYVPQEPMNKSMTKQGLFSEEESRIRIGQVVDNVMSNPYTAVAKHEGKLIALRLVSLTTRDQFVKDLLNHTSELGKMLKRLCENRTEELPDKFLHFEISTIHRDYQRMGICGLMADWTLERAKKDALEGGWLNGCGGVVSEASSLFSQRLLMKRGFQCSGEVPYADYLDPTTGLPVFQHTDPHPSVKLLLLHFDQSPGV